MVAKQKSSGPIGYRFNVYILTFVWTFFLTSGIYMGRVVAPFSKDALSIAITSECVFGILIVSRLIVVLSSILLGRSYFQWGLIVPVCIRAFSYGYLFGMSCAVWGSAAWLFGLLFFIPNTIFTIADLWLWVVLIR